MYIVSYKYLTDLKFYVLDNNNNLFNGRIVELWILEKVNSSVKFINLPLANFSLNINYKIIYLIIKNK